MKTEVELVKIGDKWSQRV